MLDLVAEQVQRHQRVHPGRLDAAPAAVPLLPGDDPLGAAPQRGPADGLDRACRAVTMQRLVQDTEGARPWIAEVLGRGDPGPELVDGEREPAGRAEGLD